MICGRAAQGMQGRGCTFRAVAHLGSGRGGGRGAGQPPPLWCFRVVGGIWSTCRPGACRRNRRCRWRRAPSRPGSPPGHPAAQTYPGRRLQWRRQQRGAGSMPPRWRRECTGRQARERQRRSGWARRGAKAASHAAAQRTCEGKYGAYPGWVREGIIVQLRGKGLQGAGDSHHGRLRRRRWDRAPHHQAAEGADPCALLTKPHQHAAGEVDPPAPIQQSRCAR